MGSFYFNIWSHCLSFTFLISHHGIVMRHVDLASFDHQKKAFLVVPLQHVDGSLRHLDQARLLALLIGSLLTLELVLHVVPGEQA